MDMGIGFIEVAVAVHDIFFSIVVLEKMKSVREILFAFIRAEFEHEIGRSSDDDIFKPDSVDTRLAF